MPSEQNRAPSHISEVPGCIGGMVIDMAKVSSPLIIGGLIVFAAVNFVDRQGIDSAADLIPASEPNGEGAYPAPSFATPISHDGIVPTPTREQETQGSDRFKSGTELVNALPFGRKKKGESSVNEQPTQGDAANQTVPAQTEGSICDSGASYIRQTVTGVTVDGQEFSGKADGAENHFTVQDGFVHISCDEIQAIFSVR